VIAMTLGHKIKDFRKAKQITQEELAKMFGVDRSTVGKWESDSSKPDIEVLMKLSEIFDVSTDYLLGKVDYSKLDVKYDSLRVAEEVKAYEKSPRSLHDVLAAHFEGQHLSEKQLQLIEKYIDIVLDKE
jgi:transcriptional regulator with XRE-family HTH domain